MSRTLQIIELIVSVMEKEPGRYKLEVTSWGMCVTNHKGMNGKDVTIPQCLFHFYTPLEEYEVEGNKIFEDFISGLKA